jgi:hypothetical protein
MGILNRAAVEGSTINGKAFRHRVPGGGRWTPPFDGIRCSG